MWVAFTLRDGSSSRREQDYMLVRPSGKDEVLGAARLVCIAGDLHRAVVGCRFAADEPLRVEGPRAAGAVGHALGDAAAVGIDEPAQVQHFAERESAEIK